MLTRRHKGHHKHQRGQSFFIIVVIMAVFLLGVLGLATDYTQIWAHRQMVQGAADAACQAGAADLYLNYANPSAATTYSLDFSWIGSDYDCSQSGPGGNTGRYTGSPPCRYAMTNGYSGSNVAVTFPSSLPGAPNLGGFGTIAHPYIKVAITDPVGLSFANILERIGHVNTGASAACGLAPVAVPVPLAVLHQTASGSLNRNGGATITIFGGPNRAVQVDSSSSTAVLPTSGGSGLIDLRNAGPAGTGADFGLFGQEAQPSSVKLGVGTWISPAVPYGDPWTTVSAPTEPAAAGLTTAVGFTYHGCPDPSGCAEFAGGDYTACTLGSAITSGQTACPGGARAAGVPQGESSHH